MSSVFDRTDGYKFSHWKQYPKDCTNIYSYGEARKPNEKIVWFGLQYYLKKYIANFLFPGDVSRTKERIQEAFGSDSIFNKQMEELVDKYDYLPLRIKAPREGSIIDSQNVLMTIENTDPNFPWLTNFVETILTPVWYSCSIASDTLKSRELFERHLNLTGEEGCDYKLIDFGMRGASSYETAGIGGAAHMLMFKGTDNLAAVHFIRDYYGENLKNYTIPAAEHSTVTVWNDEAKCVENLLNMYESGPVALPIDSYDMFNFVDNVLPIFKERILGRDGVFILRPDSGNPIEILPELLFRVANVFGAQKNQKGYLTLNPKVRFLWGDGIKRETPDKILFKLMEEGWSCDNVNFGSGGGLLQSTNRDVYSFATKCSSAEIDGKQVDVFKTTQGKESKRGRFKLIKEEKYITVPESDEREDLLETVYENGQITEWTWADICRTLAESRN